MRSTISFAGKPRSSSIRIFLILEYAPNREVYKQLTKAKGLGDKRAATYIYQMCVALEYTAPRTRRSTRISSRRTYCWASTASS